ncbi:MAG: glutamate synthase large subunit, partial [Candidatus Omnitrophota bacterium]
MKGEGQRANKKFIGLYEPRFEHDNCGVGFVCHIKGQRSYSIVKQALEVLKRLAHRGAVGADPDTGDGAGILLQTPHSFFKKITEKSSINLPNSGDYGTGLVFLPKDIEERLYCKEIFYKIIKKEEQLLLGWRSVETDSSSIGKTARKTQPAISQIFIGKGKNITGQLEFERKLYLIRKEVENALRKSALKQGHFFHIVSLSSKTFIYKGLLMPHQLDNFFPELKNKSLKSSIALVHSRYSTNTFPSWSLAQPFRFLAHNGEINTLRGNINWMQVRQGQLNSTAFGEDINRIKPILTPDLSDSATIDNAFEFLVLGGKPLYQAMMMLIPSAWENNPLLDKKIRNFYKYQACFSEPWDGPAALAFSDGRSVGAVLDRNGLRPARYIITKDDRAVMASEVGVLDINPADILVSGRIKPGRMFYIDTESGRIISDSEIKNKVAESKPYSIWIKENMLDLENLPSVKAMSKINLDVSNLLKAFGYSREDLKTILSPMAQKGVEPTGSMGNDTPLAVLSQKPQLLYNYFKQLFAQVTNPAIDPIREECVMSLESFLGPQKNILEETPEHCRSLRVKNPILTDQELLKIKNIKEKGFKTKTISLVFNTKKEDDFISSLERICREAVLAINKGYSFIILSDRGVNEKQAALPALLSVGAVHHHLVKKSIRTQASIIVESAEPREVHHFALLFGYGADCVNPYLAYQAIDHLIEQGLIDIDSILALKNYRKAVTKGILKILSKMGISTLQSYRGAQIFEALGLDKEVIDKCFSGTVSRIKGAGFKVIEQEALFRHKQAFSENNKNLPLDSGGVYQWKKDGEFHLWQPQSIAALQDAVRTGDYQKYKQFSQLIDDQSNNPTTLRGLLRFKKAKSIAVEEVEPIEKIFKRFAAGAMSFGSISKGAHETLALAMNHLGAKSNTGEGGEDPERFKPQINGSSKRSAIKQVASGRFGVTTNYLVNADEIQIKIAQGAKPGEGGQLPGHKVSAIIARTRYTTPWVTLISPPPHH